MQEVVLLIATDETRLIALLEEPIEARARAATLLGSRLPAWSLDLFRHPAVISAFGCALAADLLYSALHFGRMRIPAENADAIVALLGVERARN